MKHNLLCIKSSVWSKHDINTTVDMSAKILDGCDIYEPVKFLLGIGAIMSRKIYFAGSIRAGREDADLYARLIEQLQKYGTVLTEHVGSKTVDNDEKLNDKGIHDRDMEWLNESDYLVAEVTQPSLGVGYEIGRAVDLKKNILCLFRTESGKRLSAMIQGAVNDSNFTVKHYKESEAPSIFKEFFMEEL